MHIQSVAGVSPIILRNCRPHGYTGQVITRSVFNLYGINEHYGCTVTDRPAHEFLHIVNMMAYKHGILHVHADYGLLPALRRQWPDKIIILHYHGVELTNCPDDDFRLQCAGFADAVAYSTLDMKDAVAGDPVPQVHIPNTVDLDLFRPVRGGDKDPKALFVTSKEDDLDAIKEYLARHCPWEYHIHDRGRDPIQYTMMPEFLSRYSRYINCRIVRGKKYRMIEMPITPMQAVACGLEIWDAWTGKVIKELPQDRTPGVQGRIVSELYADLYHTRGKSDRIFRSAPP